MGAELPSVDDGDMNDITEQDPTTEAPASEGEADALGDASSVPPAGGAPPEEGTDPTGGAPLPPAPRFLRRSERGPIAGVATGIADYFRIEPILVQAAFIAFTVFGGSGVLLYLAGWLLIPKASDPDRRPIAVATGSAVSVVFGAIFLVGAASALLGAFSFGPADNILIPVLLVGAGLFLLNQRADRPDVIERQTASARAQASPHWATARTSADGVEAPASFAARTIEPREPAIPVTSVTLAAAALVAGGLIAANEWTSLSVGAAGVIGAALVVVGAGLVFSAFKGRALPLIPVGLLLAATLFAAPVIDTTVRGGLGERVATPRSEGEVLDRYELGAGPFDIDLRNVEFVNDRTIVVDVGAGEAQIIVPRNVEVHVEATNGAGVIELFGAEYEGIRHSASASRPAIVDDTITDELESGEVADPVRVDIIVNVTFGKVEVRRG